jgi:phosphoserine phosphatase RsbU/P
MINDDSDGLRRRIQELEEEVRAREADLSTYRDELRSANVRLEKLIRDLNQELKSTLQIQRWLVPTEFPNIPGFEFSTQFVPSMKKGGDYFDIFEHDDRRRFGLVVASSTGHMMSALLLSILLRVNAQIASKKGSQPHDVVKRILSELKGQLQSGDSADLFLGSFDRRNFDFDYCMVGQVIGLRYDYGSAELRMLRGTEEPLSLALSADLSTDSVALNPRDKLIFCTRGLLEAQDLDGTFYGIDRLLRSVHEVASRSVHEVRNNILFRAQSFLTGQEPPRDMTVVVLEVKDRVIKLARG